MLQSMGSRRVRHNWVTEQQRLVEQVSAMVWGLHELGVSCMLTHVSPGAIGPCGAPANQPLGSGPESGRLFSDSLDHSPQCNTYIKRAYIWTIGTSALQMTFTVTDYDAIWYFLCTMMYSISLRKKKLVVTQQIDLMTFSLTNSGLRGNGWNLSERRTRPTQSFWVERKEIYVGGDYSLQAEKEF